MFNLTVGELQEYVESLPDDYNGVGLHDVDSSRGYYDQPAFTFSKSVTKPEMLHVLNRCLKDTFVGYKGGEYKYNEWSSVNFDEYGAWSDGQYFAKWMADNYDSEFFSGLIKFAAGKL